MTTTTASPSATLRQTFDRIDKNRDSALTRAEVKKSMEDQGVGDGWFGGMKVDGATDALVTNLDANKDGKVAWDEYVKNGHKLAPAGMPLDPAKMQDGKHLDDAVAALYRAADTDRDGALSREEITRHQTQQAERAGQGNADTRGEITAKLILGNLDKSRDGKLQKQELRGFLADVAAEQAKQTR